MEGTEVIAIVVNQRWRMLRHTIVHTRDDGECSLLTRMDWPGGGRVVNASPVRDAQRSLWRPTFTLVKPTLGYFSGNPLPWLWPLCSPKRLFVPTNDP